MRTKIIIISIFLEPPALQPALHPQSELFTEIIFGNCGVHLVCERDRVQEQMDGEG